jgi:hypothetical protein
VENVGIWMKYEEIFLMSLDWKQRRSKEWIFKQVSLGN